MIKTPLGKVKIGKNQFEKLECHKNEGRDKLLFAMYLTLKDPVVIINEKRDDQKAVLFISSFKRDNKKTKIINSVVITKQNVMISISTHRKELNSIIRKIKNASDILYCKNATGIVSGKPDDG